MGSPDRTVILLMDSVRRDALACYGGPHPFPNIDRMASAGIMYSHAKAPAGWTLTTADGMAKRWEEIIPGSVLITDNPILNESELNRRFEHYVYPPFLPVPPVDVAPMINWWFQHRDTRLVFFWTAITHAPYISWAQEHQYEQEAATLWDQDVADPMCYPIPHLQQSVEYILARYYGAIAAIDRYVIPELDADKIILLSDHGECFGEHGLWGHARRKYKELVDVPLIISGLGHATIEKPFQIGRLYELTQWVMDAPLPSDEEIVQQRLRDLGYVAT